MRLLDLIEPVLNDFPEVGIRRTGLELAGYKTEEFRNVEAIGDYRGVWVLTVETTKVHVHVIPRRNGIDFPENLWHETIDAAQPNIDLLEQLRTLIKLGILKANERSD